jgi:hypothetical protein
MGGGRGWRHRFYATGVPGWAQGQAGSYVPPAANPKSARDEELLQLREQAQYFKDALHDLEKRIDEIQSQSPKTD